MQLPNLDPTRDPQELYEDIKLYIAQADALVTARDDLSLVGLNSAVDALCTRVLALDKAEAAHFSTGMGELTAQLDQLRQKIISLQNEVSTTMMSLGKNQKAARAYKTTPGTTES